MANFPILKMPGGCCAAGCSENYLPLAWYVDGETDLALIGDGAGFNRPWIIPYLEGPVESLGWGCHWQSEIDEGHIVHVYKLLDVPQTQVTWRLLLYWSGEYVAYAINQGNGGACHFPSLAFEESIPGGNPWAAPGGIGLRPATYGDYASYP